MKFIFDFTQWPSLAIPKCIIICDVGENCRVIFRRISRRLRCFFIKFYWCSIASYTRIVFCDRILNRIDFRCFYDNDFVFFLRRFLSLYSTHIFRSRIHWSSDTHLPVIRFFINVFNFRHNLYNFPFSYTFIRF